MSYVAKGRLEGLWERSVNPWDVMAGIIIAREAGGKVTDYSDQQAENVHSGKQVLASNGFIHQQMLDVLNAAK